MGITLACELPSRRLRPPLWKYLICGSVPVALNAFSFPLTSAIQIGRRHYGFSIGARTLLPHSVHDPS